MNKMDHNGSLVDHSMEQREGNVKPPAARQKMGRYWCSGVFNYTLEQLDQIFRPHVKRFVAYAEKCPKTGRKHYQCYWDFGKRIRPKEKFSKIDIFWIFCKGNALQNIEYCQKSGSSDCLEIPTPYKVSIDLYDWQKKLKLIIDEEPDDRKIYWIWESLGNSGKTTFQKWIFQNYKNCVVLSGKGSDMKNGIIQYEASGGTLPEIVLINIPRSSSKFVSWSGIEEIKDMFFFSGKYEGGMVCGKPPHVLIFANIAPPLEEMSEDRWEIIEI